MEKLNKLSAGILFLDEVKDNKYRVSSPDSKYFGLIFEMDDIRLDEFETIIVDNILNHD